MQLAYDERLARPHELSDVGFAVIDTAEVRGTEAMLCSGGSPFKKVTTLQPALLIQHPQGNIVFDTGIGNAADFGRHCLDSFPRIMGWSPGKSAQRGFKRKGSVREQISAAIDPDSIRCVIMSHLHFDHAAGIEEFPLAQIWVSQADYNVAVKSQGRGYSRSLLNNPAVRWRFLQLTDTPYESFDQSIDWFGDGSIVLVPLPGHTPGLTGVFVNLRSGDRYFYVNAMAYPAPQTGEPMPPNWIQRATASNRAQMKETYAKIHAVIDQRPNVTVVMVHDNLRRIEDLIFPQVAR